jgi:hypothetical protein
VASKQQQATASISKHASQPAKSQPASKQASKEATDVTPFLQVQNSAARQAQCKQLPQLCCVHVSR